MLTQDITSCYHLVTEWALSDPEDPWELMCNPGTIREGSEHPKGLGAWVSELGFLFFPPSWNTVFLVPPFCRRRSLPPPKSTHPFTPAPPLGCSFSSGWADPAPQNN